jgi:hypothetical protein
VATAIQPVRAVPGQRDGKIVASVESFDRIVDEYQRRLYGFALRKTRSSEPIARSVRCLPISGATCVFSRGSTRLP